MKATLDTGTRRPAPLGAPLLGFVIALTVVGGCRQRAASSDAKAGTTFVTSPAQVAGPSDFPLRAVVLEQVSNASGLELVYRNGERLVATLDEVSEWAGRPDDAPPMILLSRVSDGKAVGGERRVGQFGEVEALATRDGRLVFPYKRHGQVLVVRDGEKDIPLVDEAIIARLKEATRAVAEPPFWFEFEGLDFENGRWEVLVSAVHQDAPHPPESTLALFRLRVSAEGRFESLSGALRWWDGSLYRDYGGAIDVLPDGRALVPGFFSGGVSVVGEDGRVVRHIKLATRRIEGLAWDSAAKELLLVRECVGDFAACAPGAAFGTTLWIASIPDGF